LPKNELKKAAVHLASLRLTILRCSQRSDASESRFAPPNRLSSLCCAAQLRKMAPKKKIKTNNKNSWSAHYHIADFLKNRRK
jgi:hypothetical protein